MRQPNHILAKQLVQGALERFTSPDQATHEGDAQLIVLGAILEEVTRGHNPNNNSLRSRARTTAPPLLIGGGTVAIVIELLRAFA